MLNFLYRQRIQTNLFLLVGFLLGGMVLFGFLSYYTLEKLKIKGPYYDKIVLSQDLIADVLPPPEYIIESYLLAFQQIEEATSRGLDKLIARSEKLRQEYEDRHRFWEQNIPEGHLKDIFIVQSNKIVEEFFDIYQNSFLPALKSNNKDKAHSILMGPLTEKYNQHRAIIDEVIKVTTKQSEDIESEVTDIYNKSLNLSLAVWILSFIVGGIIAWAIAHAITQKVNDIITGIVPISVEISNRMDQQAHVVAQQSSAVQETTATMNELSVSFKHTESLASESSERAKNALKVSEEGNSTVKVMTEGLANHKEKVSAILEQIIRLSELIQQIHSIAAVTSNLTNQTNILALNAAVQAVHVKQQSEGFSVIANEIRKLADDSKKFLAHIDVLAQNIQKATNSAIAIAEEGSKNVQEIMRLTQNTSKAFDTIISINTISYEAAEQVSMNVKQQGLAVNQVLDAMENLNEVAGQSVTGMKQVHNELTKLNVLTNNLKSVV